MSVITDAEGDCLDDMAKGLVSRYERHHVEPPKVLYVDRDCCGIRLAQQFSGWPNLVTKLDMWHYMRRFSMACCSESHALYGTFMSKLSGCMFEWDPEDQSISWFVPKSNSTIKRAARMTSPNTLPKTNWPPIVNVAPEALRQLLN